MDVKGFAEALLGALTDAGLFERVALQTEGPVAHGMAYVREDLFLRFLLQPGIRHDGLRTDCGATAGLGY